MSEQAVASATETKEVKLANEAVLDVDKIAQSYDQQISNLTAQRNNIDIQINQLVGAKNFVTSLKSQNILLLDTNKLPKIPATPVVEVADNTDSQKKDESIGTTTEESKDVVH